MWQGIVDVVTISADDSPGGLRQLLATVSEPTRFRIVLLLAQRPHTVGEVAAAIGALQPQTTKHLQALETAGVVRIQRLGRRRLAALDHDALRGAAEQLRGLAAGTYDDVVLRDYTSAVVDTQERLAVGTLETAVHLTRTFPVDRSRVWDAWTDPQLRARWWAPRHFTVEASVFEPVAGGRAELRLRERDGAVYQSDGEVIAVDHGRRLEFTLAPLDPGGRPMLDAHYLVTLDGESPCTVDLRIRAGATTPEAAPMLAGLEPGWTQLLDALHVLLTESGR